MNEQVAGFEVTRSGTACQDESEYKCVSLEDPGSDGIVCSSLLAAASDPAMFRMWWS